MINARTLAICTIGTMLLTIRVAGQGPAQYRNFELKSDLAAVSTLAGVPASEAKLIHQRPAVMQELEWRPSRWIAGTSDASTDPVERMIFSFYNNQLFRIVVDYGYDRTEGMTDADMIDAITSVYGTPVKRTGAAVRAPNRIEVESGSVLARWGDTSHGVVLYKNSTYRRTFRLIVTDPTLDDLSRKADSEALRLDAQEAPSREVARLKKESDDGRTVAEKARVANKAAFRP
jgi:hypothetical protein